MTSKRWIRMLLKHPDWNKCDIDWSAVKQIADEQEMLEHLMNPLEEESKDGYLRHSQWYYNECLGELCCGTTIYKEAEKEYLG